MSALRTLDGLSRSIARLAVEVADAAKNETSNVERQELSDVAALLLEAAIRVLDGAVVDEHPHAAALREMCVCGHDRGDHLVEPPHADEKWMHSGGRRGCAGFRVNPGEYCDLEGAS